MQKKFQKHCSTKTSKKLYHNKRTCYHVQGLSTAAFHLLFNSMATWRNVTHFDKLHKLQKRAARIITNSSYEVIENILNRREQVMTFMALREMTPKYLTELFSSCQNYMYGLRSNNRNYIYQNLKQVF